MSLFVPDGEPCSPGCASHISHPCERCGRIGARGDTTIVSSLIDPGPKVRDRMNRRFLEAMSEQRKDRREQERVNAKAFEGVVKDIREALEDRPAHDELKQAIQAALERLEMNEQPNNLIAAQLILATIHADQRGDESAKLLFYLAGVVVEETLQKLLMTAVSTMMQTKPIIGLPPLG